MTAASWLLWRASFRSLLAVNLVLNLGTLMQGVATTWLLLGLTSSATLIALHQTASAAPVFLLVLVAGALTDVVDRRSLLWLSLALLALVALTLTTITLAGQAAPIPILLLVFALGVGSAFSMPVGAALIPELVAEDELGPANALIGGAGSLAAAFGPPLAGLIITRGGPAAVFLFDALLFTSGIVLVVIWKHQSSRHLPAEHLIQAIRLGLRYTHYAGPFRGLLIRAAAFALLASAGLALFPLVARLRLAVDAGGLGLLFGLAGVGFTGGALVVPGARKLASLDAIAASATVLVALGLAGLALAPSFFFVCVSLLAIGFGQSALTTGLVLAAQHALADWVRGRGLAVYLLVFYLATTIGSALWGLVAASFGLPAALLGAAVGVVATLALAPRFRLSEAEQLDSAPAVASLFHATHQHGPGPGLDDGPVLVTITYEVNPSNGDAFVAAMNAAGEHRRRDGAMQWGLYGDVDHPERYVEVFMAASWVEHMRQRERPTQDDLRAWDAVRPLYQEICVQHFVAPSAWKRISRQHQPQPENSERSDTTRLPTVYSSPTRSNWPSPGDR
jgi:MFS family permease